MKDFLLIIKTKGSVWTDLTPEQLQKHLEHGNTYIGKLIKDGKSIRYLVPDKAAEEIEICGYYKNTL